MQKFNFLVSYPKSGNTWFRIFLTNYLRNENTPAKINDLDRISIISSRLLFDNITCIDSSLFSEDILDTLRPRVYRYLAKNEKLKDYYKVHDSFSCSKNGIQLFPKEIIGKVLYFIRNPLDICVSFAHHNGHSIDRTVENICDKSYVFGPKKGKYYAQLRQKLSCWSGHIKSWTEESDISIKTIRYEDMQLNTEKTFLNAVRFLELPEDISRLKKALEFSSFKVLNEQEKDEGFKEKNIKSKSLFFRNGKIGSWRKELSDKHVKKICKTHYEIMNRFNYIDENKNPVF